MENDIKKYIKQRGYTVQKVIKLLGFTVPTLEKFVVKHPQLMHYAIKGLPEISHIKSERLETIRPAKDDS